MDEGVKEFSIASREENEVEEGQTSRIFSNAALAPTKHSRS